MSNLSIVPVQREDIPRIHEIARSWELQRLTSTNQGFLVSSFSEEEYSAFLEQPNRFVKAEVDGDILGFLYGFSSDAIKPTDVVNSFVKFSLDGDFFLIKQICVAADHPGSSGVAAALYDWLKSVESGPLLAAIVLEPANPRSIAFHEKQGFEKLYELEAPRDPDGRKRLRGIWQYQPEKASLQVNPRLRWIADRSAPEHLVEYYSAAVALYTHEDNLNWTKLGLLVTFMLALLATFPFMARQDPANPLTWLVTPAVILVGFLLLSLFGAKLTSGIRYMANHKAAVLAIEKRLVRNFDLTPILNTDNSEISRQSKTVSLLQRIPLVATLIWGVYSLVLVGRLLMAML